MDLELTMGHLGVGAALWFSDKAFELEFSSTQHASRIACDASARSAAEFLVFDRRRLDVDVNPVKQRPGNPIAIVLDLFRRAAAFPFGSPKYPHIIRDSSGENQHNGKSVSRGILGSRSR